MNPTFHTFWFSTLIVICCGLLATGGLLLVRKFVSHETLEMHHAVAGSIICILGTLYAVVLGFIVVDALNHYQKARITAEHEANALHDLFHLGSGLADPSGHHLRLLCMDYAHAVTEHEWKTMQDGLHYRPVHFIVTGMWDTVVHYQPRGAHDSDIQAALLTKMSDLGDNRHSRLISAQSRFHPIIWAVLFFGGTMLVIFTYLFGVANLRTQITMTMLLVLVLGLNLMIVAMWGTPFTGDERVPPAALQLDIATFRSELAEEKR